MGETNTEEMVIARVGNSVLFEFGSVDGYIYTATSTGKPVGRVSCCSGFAMSPTEARSFAARVIAVADEVDAEVERIKGGTPCAE